MVQKLFSRSLPILFAFLFFISRLSFAQSPSFKWAGRIGGVNSTIPADIATDLSGNVITVGYLGLPAISDFDPGPGTYFIPAPGSQNMYISKLDAAGAFVWAKAIGGQGMNEITGITTDSARNIYIAGGFSNSADFDPGTGTMSMNSNGGSTDIFVAKLDSNANLLWVKAIGGSGTDQATALAVDASGDVYVTGNFTGSVDFDPGLATYSLFGYNSDAFVLKLSTGGAFVWAKNFGGNLYDDASDIAVDASSNTFVTGRFSGFGVFGNYTMAAMGTRDVFVSKLDNAGNVLWAKQIGGNLDSPLVYSLALDKADNVFIAGKYFNKVDLDPNSGTSFINAINYTCGNYFVAKLASGGGYVWGTSYVLPPVTCESNMDLATDTNGNLYATGIFTNGDFDPGPATLNILSKGLPLGIYDYDIFITRLNANGSLGWVRTLGSMQRGDQGLAIAVDLSGNVYTTGTFADTVDMDPGSNNFFLYAPDSNAGNPDIAAYVHKMGQCTPTSSVLTQTACNNFTFNGTTYTHSGTYTVLLSSVDNCDSTVTLNLTINPDTTITWTFTTLKSNETGCTYQWLDCANGMSAIPGATNALYHPGVNGSFAVALNKNGCVDTSRCFYVYATDVNSVQQNPVLKYYPNPVEDHVVIAFDQTYHEIRTELFNVSGQLIQKKVFNDSKTITTYFDIPPGIYLMAIQLDDSEKKWIKLVK